MPIDALPSISRSDPDFRVKVDDYFLTRLPAFSTQVESARVQIVGAESAAASAASTATTAAATATSAASGASSSASSASTSASTAATAKNAAEAAAAQAVSGNVATPIHEAVSKTTPVDADEIGLSDSAATWGLKKLTFANLKAWLSGLYVGKTGAQVMAGGLTTAAVTSSGSVLVTGSGAVGYGTGAGGAVSQATSKSTAVTLNKPCGRVTMFNDPTNFPAESAISAGGEILFQVNNNLITLTDSVIALPVAASSYLVQVLYVSTGLFVVRVVNKTGASLSEQISINFAVIKSTLS